MASDPVGPTPFSLRRWSRRKHEAARADVARPSAPRETGVPPKPAGIDPQSADAMPRAALATSAGVASVTATSAQPVPAAASRPRSASAPHAAASNPDVPQAPLPAIDSMTIDSDFSPFMQPGVDDSLKRTALRKLFSDPRFNVMDGLDVYIDDYSKPDPIDPAIVRTLVQARYIFDPPKTRVNAEGHVEDVPEAPAEAMVDSPETAEADTVPGAVAATESIPLAAPVVQPPATVGAATAEPPAPASDPYAGPAILESAIEPPRKPETDRP